MSSSSKNAEKHQNKESVHDSVESFIERKQGERANEGAREVRSAAEGVQGEVAEVMAGVEKPSEKISERRESKGDGDVKPKGGGQGDDDAIAQIQGDLGDMTFPDEEVMVKKIRTAVQIQIKQEIKRSKKLQKNLATGSAHEYNQSIARIRTLKEILSSLLHGTVDALKGLYGKYFTAEGRRKRTVEES